MTPSEIVVPMCVYTFFLLAIVLYLGYARVTSRFRGVMSREYLRAGTGPPPPDWIVDLHHHFSNQFELPLLFYFGCTLLLLTGGVDDRAVALAWSFVGLRFVHTGIVLVRNNPGIRVFPYVLSTIVVGILWGDLLSHVLRQGS